MVVGHEDLGRYGGRRNNVATSCLVFMIRGLAANWKQPLNYVMTSHGCKADVVRFLLFDCIDKLSSVGLNVVAIISDQGANFQQLTRLLGVTTVKPYFEYHEKRYFYLFDPPHLLKSVRNNLQKYNFVFDGTKTASWSDIAEFYRIDEQQRFRLAPKLTKKHIELPAFSKMKVKFATQVISRTVAAGLETHAKLKGLGGSNTAEFLVVFDELFDAMNSSQRTCVKQYNCALTADGEHIQLFKQRVQWLKGLSVKDQTGKDVTSIIKCINGWCLTLSAVVEMWPMLQQCGFEFLFTRRLNQDPLENFFAAILARGGNSDNPTPLMFGRLFKQICCQTLCQPIASANCEFDSATLPQSILNISTGKQATSADVVGSECPPLTSVLAMECHSDSDFESNGLYYVCGFLLRKVFKRHWCSDCAELCITQPCKFGDANSVYTSYRMYSERELKAGDGLLTVSNSFFCYVSQCECGFLSLFDRRGHEPGILNMIVKELSNYTLPVTCKKFPKLFFLRYFVRMRIFYKLKFFNRLHSGKSEHPRKNRKLVKLQHV